MSWLKAILSKLRKKPKGPETREGLEYLFSYAGHNFYTFRRIEETAARRYLAYIRLVRMHELGVSRDDLKKFTAGIRQANNRGDKSAVGALCEALEAYTDLYTDNQRIFEIANCFVLVDDEPVGKFSEIHSLLKKQLYDGSDQVRFFFIESALKYLRKISDLPDDLDLGAYLREGKVELTEKVFSRLITRDSSEK